MTRRRTRSACLGVLIALSASSMAKEVTLDLVAVPLPEAIDLFAEATGCTIRHTLHGKWKEKMIDLTFDRTPFWKALDQLCEAGEVSYSPWTGDARMMIHPGKRRTGLVQYSGPCRFEVTSATRSVYYSTGNDSAPRLSVSVRVLWEPDWSVMGIDHQLRAKTAIKDDGTSLVLPVDPRRRVHFGSVHNRCEHHSGLQLQVPAQAGGTLKTLEGSIAFAVASREEEGTFENIMEADGKEIVAGELTVKIGTVRMMGEVCVVRVTATKPHPRDRPNMRTPVTFELEDDTGKKLRASSTRSKGNRGNVEATLQFRMKGTQPAKLHFKWLAEHEETEVPFKFENLKLP